MKISSRSNCQKVNRIIKDMDIVGVPVSLTYKNDTHFKSLPGGIMTIVIRLGIIAYFVQQLILLFSNNSTITNTYFRRDFNTDQTVYNLTKKDFNFGIRVFYLFQEKEPLVQA